MATNAVIITNCWAFENGGNLWNDSAFADDGNGFKLGGNYLPGPHHVVRCVSFKNPATGFDQNNNTAGLTLDQNTAWANAKRNFNLNHGVNETPQIVRNNISFQSGGSDSFSGNSELRDNSWQVLSSAPSPNDFLSLDTSLASGPRNPDGSLPETPLLRPVPGGRLVNKGVDIGEPFVGSAPDLGAFESPEW